MNEQAIDAMAKRGPTPEGLETIAGLLEIYHCDGFAEVCRRWAQKGREEQNERRNAS